MDEWSDETRRQFEAEHGVTINEKKDFRGLAKEECIVGEFKKECMLDDETKAVFGIQFEVPQKMVEFIKQKKVYHRLLSEVTAREEEERNKMK